jgi:hypothetical protein
MNGNNGHGISSGECPVDRIVKALEPLVEKYGWDKVRPAWQRYLAATEFEDASPERFAYSKWARTPPKWRHGNG